jgi:DNA polymerase-3 subunit epsilon
MELENESKPISKVTFQDVVSGGDYVVLDTETTGLGEDAEICQIAIIDSHGNTLLDTLVNPRKPIPHEAIVIHHITDALVENAPRFVDVLPMIHHYLDGRDVIVYNADYDRKMLHRSGRAWGLPQEDWEGLAVWWCAMERFASIFGEWNSYRGGYKWQKLTTACNYYGLPVANAHSALGDCLMTLEVVKAMIAKEIEDSDHAKNDG